MCRVGILTTVLIHRVVMRHKQDNVGKALKTVTDTMYISFQICLHHHSLLMGRDLDYAI